MKRYVYILLVCMFVCCAAAFAQTVTLGFTAKDAANQYVRLNRVVIANLTRNWQETIYWPDTILTIQNGTGIADVEMRGRASLQLSQNNPNPFIGTTGVSLTVVKEGELGLQIADVNGKIVETQDFVSLQPGVHQFRIALATAGTYVMTARQNGCQSSIKMVCNGAADGNKIEYTGSVGPCTVALQSPKSQNAPKYTTTGPFAFDDQMEYVGYAIINGTEAESQHITQAQNASQSFTLQFAETGGNPLDGQPCTGIPTLTDIDNNTYNTVQIGNQCWMKENLRTTHYSNGTSIPLGSTYSYNPYCYYPNNSQSNVSTYGYLYNLRAVMGNSSSSSDNPNGVQGVCPIGWHVPSDAEWTQLTDYVSSQSQYVCGGDNTYIAKALASTTGWDSETGTCVVGSIPNANNATGFSALPAGRELGNFGFEAYFWSATGESGSLFARSFSSYSASVNRFEDYAISGYSVRCIRNTMPTVYTAPVSNITLTTATSGGNVVDDAGTVVTARGVCWSTMHNPSVIDDHTSDGGGVGDFTSSLTDLSSNTTYYVRAYATNSAGIVYGDELRFVTGPDGQPCSGAATVTDIDSNTYNTVQIGNQCWMKENLRTTRYANGTSIALGSSTSYTTAYRYYPDNNSSNVSTYGYLYNWPAVMGGSSSSSANPSGVQGICPNGWHVPSNTEWTLLTYYVSCQSRYLCGSNPDNIAKALASTTGWYTSWNMDTCAVGDNSSANNTTGFSALPAGRYAGSGCDFSQDAYFWSATEYYYYDQAYPRHLYYDSDNVGSLYTYKYYGHSVRCVRDN